MKRTLKRELKVFEIVASDAFEVSVCLISGCFLLIFLLCLNWQRGEIRSKFSQGRRVGINYKMSNIVSGKNKFFSLVVVVSVHIKGLALWYSAVTIGRL